MINVIINGGHGKMGEIARLALNSASEFNIKALSGRNDDLQSLIKTTDTKLVIDVTSAKSAFDNSLSIIEAGAHPVIGTSGLLEHQIQHLQQLCQHKKLGGIIAPNFSLGAILMMKYALDAAKHFSYAEIIEMHHEKKLDAPSGTAMKTASMLNKALQEHSTERVEEETLPGARGAKMGSIPLHSVRMPGIMAEQQLIFGNLGETLRIEHRTINRDCYIPGILLACRKALELDSLVYGLEHLID